MPKQNSGNRFSNSSVRSGNGASSSRPLNRRQVREQIQSLVMTREVLVVDNRPLRERHFLEARKVIEKIERLEEKIRLFHSSDQKRFDQWYDLTFRQNRLDQESARTKYQELARFHNWVVATAHKLDIEMPQAYILMRDEELRWQQGTPEVRKQIDHERERREAYIRQEFRARYNENFSYDGDEDDESTNGGIEGLEQVLSRLEAIVLDAEEVTGEDTPAQARIERIMALSDERLLAVMDDQEAAFMLFDVSLNWGQTHHDYALFKRLWSLMTPTQRTFFAYVYSSVTDDAIEEFLVSIGLSPDFDAEVKADEEGSEDDDEAFSFDDQYIDDESPRPKPGRAKTTIVNDEKLKQTFRKLMRKLHPDVHSSSEEGGKTPAWVQRIWGLVQNAYNSKNSVALERLLKLTLIRMNVLDELTVGEISEARHWLKQDLESLESESEGLRNSPAWGFTQKKNFTSLTQKISRQLEGELREILDQVEELESQHRLFEMLAAQGSRPQRAQRERRRGRATAPKRRSRRQSRQGSFSFED